MGEASSQQTAAAWRDRALEAAGNWLHIDSALRVLDTSVAAQEFFLPPPLPAGIVAVTRSRAVEDRAREVVDSAGRGPWEIEVAHFQAVLRMWGEPLGADGAVLFFDDLTELRRLEAVRADFVANLAHELRTPVASLSLAVETLSADLPPAEQHRFLARIAEETKYIEGLLRNISELALLESHVRLSPAEFVLREAVEESWRRVTDRQGGAPLQNEVPPRLTVTADPVRVSEILQNLLENAHRFSPAGAPVEVAARGAGTDVEVSVLDRGPGIPAAEIGRVFERFYKVDRARTRHGEGSGLGLAIVKHLVSAHGGRVWAEAVNPHGTVVRFTLPG